LHPQQYATTIADEAIYGDECDDDYDDEDYKPHGKSPNHNASSDSEDDESDSMNDGDISI
jgi:hypothetical protein